MFQPNQYPGRCNCGEWVPAGEGKVDPPARRGGKWETTCFVCMTPEEQAHARRQAEHSAKLHREHQARQHAAGSARA